MSAFNLKIILLRWFGVGKIIDKIVKNRYRASYKLSVGVDILTKDVNFNKNEFAALSIWDIHHHQRFEFIESTLFKGTAGVIIIFDLINEKTYRIAIEKYKEIKNIAGAIPFLLIGDNYQRIEDFGRYIDEEETRLFAQKEGGIYIEISPQIIDLLEEAIKKMTIKIIDNRLNIK